MTDRPDVANGQLVVERERIEELLSYKRAYLSLRGTMKGIAEDRTITTLENARAVARAALARVLP